MSDPDPGPIEVEGDIGFLPDACPHCRDPLAVTGVYDDEDGDVHCGRCDVNLSTWPDDAPIRESNAITRTSTAVVLELADGREVELTAHVATPRDDGLRGMDPIDPDGERSNTQQAFQAGPARLILRDLTAEADDPIGLLPVDADRFDIDAPDDWTELDRDDVRKRIHSDTDVVGPVFEHASVEAWLQIRRKVIDGYPTFHVYLEGGTPSTGIHPLTEEHVQGDFPDQVEDVAEQMLAEYEPPGEADA